MEKITIISMAKELGIAPSTVSRAFHPSSRISEPVGKKILDHAKNVGYVPNRAAARLSMGQLKVGVALGMGYEYGVNELLRGIKDAFRSLQDYKLSLKVVLYHPSKHIDNGYADIIDALSDCHCLILTGFDAKCAAEVINPISERIPVVSLQSFIEGVNVLFTSAVDPVSSSVMAADMLALALRSLDKKRVALFTGNQSNTTHRISAEVFKSACQRLGMQMVYCCDMQDNNSLLASACLDMPEVDGIYITSGKSIELCKRVEKLEKKPALVAFDIYPELAEYLKCGVISACIYQDMYHQGYNAFSLLVRHIVDRTAPPASYSPLPQAVLASTLDYYLPPKPDLSDLDIIYM